MLVFLCYCMMLTVCCWQLVIQEEDIDVAIALSLSELDQKGKNVIGKFHRLAKTN